MKTVITYGTYDLMHRGHVRLLERAKALGDYLIVGVTSDNFDCERGKINVQQSLMERVEAVRATGLADKIIIEEFQGQKIDDIKRFDVDVFTVGSDWKGKFDYLKEFCEVVYLDRTEGISSTELRSRSNSVRLGLVGESHILNKIQHEAGFVNGLEVAAYYSLDDSKLSDELRATERAASYEELLGRVDAIFMISSPELHYDQIRTALTHGRHVLCESPIALEVGQLEELLALAREKNLILMDAIKTAYSYAAHRMMLLAKSGIIGEVVSVDATCTSLADASEGIHPGQWNSICAWGPTAMLPIFQLLGTGFLRKEIITRFRDGGKALDAFTKITYVYPHAVASLKVGQGVKSEGELVISGTKGYIYVPAPWWKTDYFEVRFEDPKNNRRCFYQLDGEGLRYELLSFLKSILHHKDYSYVSEDISKAITSVISDFYSRKDMTFI